MATEKSVPWHRGLCRSCHRRATKSDSNMWLWNSKDWKFHEFQMYLYRKQWLIQYRKCTFQMYLSQKCTFFLINHYRKWGGPKIGVPPNHPFLVGFSIINHPFWGTPIYGNPQMGFQQQWLGFAADEFVGRCQASSRAHRLTVFTHAQERWTQINASFGVMVLANKQTWQYKIHHFDSYIYINIYTYIYILYIHLILILI